MSGAPDAHLDRVIDAIARYLDRNPTAADSDEGIAKWWLPTMQVEASNEEVRAALLALMRAGVIEQVRIGDERLMWRAIGRRPPGSRGK